jgi:hypothetical protein
MIDFDTEAADFPVPDELRAEGRVATPERCLQIMRTLLERYWAWLKANPEAMDRYWRRNLRKRAVPARPDVKPS